MKSSDERGTPAYIIQYAREVMGEIDLDPASCDAAQDVVRALCYYTQKDDGLVQPWSGRVWLNPPFSQPLCTMFIDRAIAMHESHHTRQTTILVNTSSGKWYHKLLVAYPVVYPCHHELHPNARIEFSALPGNDRGTGGNSGGQAIFYMAHEPWRIQVFYEVFGEFCTVPWCG